MPRLSDSMDEGQLIEWKIRPGDIVKNGDVIAEVESDKAVMEIQTFKAGRIKEILVQPGTTVLVGKVMAVINMDATVQNTQQSESAEKAESSEENVIKKEVLKKQTSKGSGSKSYTEGNASPRARSLAAEYGLDIEQLQKEEIIPVPAHFAEVKGYWLRHYFTAKALELLSRYHLSTDLFETGKKHNESEVKAYVDAHEIPLVQPLDSRHKAMIFIVNEAMKKPVYHMTDHIDTTLLKKYETKELTVTVWLIKLFGEAMMQKKYFRMTLADGGMQLWPNASISVAMASEDHLYMPVFHDVNRKTVREIAKQLQIFKAKIKEQKFQKEDLTGSTFGLSNLGMTGIESFDAMINKEDSAIAAIGSEINGRITMTLSIDHRLINGYQSAEFMQAIKALATDPMFFKGEI